MENLDYFNKIACNVFFECYKIFPVPCYIRQDVFFPEETHLLDVFYHSMLWLKEYEYITYEHSIGATVFVCRLTEKTMSIMGYMPDSLKGPKEPVSSKVAEALKTGTKEAFAEVIKQVVAYGASKFPTLLW